MLFALLLACSTAPNMNQEPIYLRCTLEDQVLFEGYADGAEYGPYTKSVEKAQHLTLYLRNSFGRLDLPVETVCSAPNIVEKP